MQKFTFQDGRHYLGIVMKIGRTEKRECNVFMLDNDIALNDLTTKLRSVDERRHNNALQLETRLVILNNILSQNYNYSEVDTRIQVHTEHACMLPWSAVTRRRL